MLCCVCQKKTEKSCSLCKSVFYCCRDCQKSDWKSHKKFCGSFTIKKEEEEKDGLKLARHSIVAAKDLQLGDRILEELPLFLISRVPYLEQANPELGKKDYLLCVTCGTNLSGFPSKRCSRCKWPVCGEFGKNCEKHNIHAENECGILASKKITYDSLPAHDDRRVLLILRAEAIKVKNPDLWDELMKRADEISIAGEDSVVNREEISKLEQVMKKLDISHENTQIYKKFSSLLNLTSICHDVQTNVVTEDGKNKRVQARIGNYLYPQFNNFSYSCAPNCNFAIDDSPTYKIHVRAARDIKKGEELTIQQGLVPWHEGTIERRLAIQNQFGYLCKCKRCSDPTEFGTFFSGIVCTECRPGGENPNKLGENVGYFLPLAPESESKDSSSPLFQCNRCKTTRPYSFFEEQLSIIRGGLDDNFGNYYSLVDPSIAAAHTELEADRVKNYLAKYSGKILHPNHFLIHKALCTLCTIYDQVLTIKNLGSDGMVKHKNMYEGCAHFTKGRVELESKLFDGAFSDRQGEDQSVIASAVHNLAQIQIISGRYKDNPLEALNIKDKLKESLIAYNLTFDFYTKYMPTTFKPKFSMDGFLKQKEMAEEQLRQFNKMFTVFR